MRNPPANAKTSTQPSSSWFGVVRCGTQKRATQLAYYQDAAPTDSWVVEATKDSELLCSSAARLEHQKPLQFYQQLLGAFAGHGMFLICHYLFTVCHLGDNLVIDVTASVSTSLCAAIMIGCKWIGVPAASVSTEAVLEHWVEFLCKSGQKDKLEQYVKVLFHDKLTSISCNHAD